VIIIAVFFICVRRILNTAEAPYFLTAIENRAPSSTPCSLPATLEEISERARLALIRRFAFLRLCKKGELPRLLIEVGIVRK